MLTKNKKEVHISFHFLRPLTQMLVSVLCFHVLFTHMWICLHLISDTMTFNLTGHNNSVLRCEVNVSQQPGYVLSILHNGCNLEAVSSISGDGEAAQPFITLSKNISLRGRGEYECQLHLDKDLITNRSLLYTPLGNYLHSQLVNTQRSCLQIHGLLLWLIGHVEYNCTHSFWF